MIMTDKSTDYFCGDMVPLTLEQLREMVGKPVWIESGDKKEWCILWGYHGPEVYGRSMIFTRRTSEKKHYQFSDYGKTWLAYSYSPAQIDREAWEGCEHCKNDSMNGEGTSHDFRVSEGAIYYYDSEFGWEGVDANYCPWCGRPLTEEAWEELEKRVRREK